VSLVLANARVVTMDDASTELDGGWIRIDDAFVSEIGAAPLRRAATTWPGRWSPPP